MNDKNIKEHASRHNFYAESNFRYEAFSRNIGILSPSEMHRLARATVAIPGMGGVGGLHLMTLTRVGVGGFHLSDFDIFETVNFNRQYGASMESLGRPKLDAMSEQALAVNPFLNIKRFPGGIDENNIDRFLENADVVLDGLDFFNFDIRRLLFTRAREKGLHVVTAGPLGFGSALLVFAPEKGMGFDEYFDIIDGMSEDEKHLSFAMGLAPRPTHIRYMDLARVSLRKGAGPSSAAACHICAGMAAVEAVRIILKRGGLKPVPYYYQFDPYLRKYRKGRLVKGNRNLLQRAKRRLVKAILQTKNRKFIAETPDLPEKVPEEKQIPPETLDFIISAGIRAPSGDNAQPWKFEKSDQSIRLFLDTKADDSFFNFRQTASIISCGAVLENMEVAASALALESETKYGSGDKGGAIAELILKPGTPERTLPVESIWNRRTNRTMYEQNPIPADLLELIQKSAAQFPSVLLHVVTDKKKLEALARIVFQADRIRSELRSLHEHLHKMIRLTEADAKLYRDGFPIQNLEAGMAGGMFLKITRPWPVMSVLNRIGAARLVAAHSYQGLTNCSAAGLLTVKGNKTSDFLTGGRALQRIWLTLTSCNLDMQPMTAITLFLLRLHNERPSSSGFPTNHRKLLAALLPRYQALFPESDFSTESQVMLFRMGYGRPIKCGTLRKSLEDLTKPPVL